MCELHWLADVDDPHFILEPKQVVLAQVAMDQGTLILHGIHYLQIESEDEVDFSSFSLFSVLVIINNVKILVTKRLYLKVFRIWIIGQNIILRVSVMIFQLGNHPYLRRQVLQIDLHQKKKIFSFIYFKIRQHNVLLKLFNIQVHWQLNWWPLILTSMPYIPNYLTRCY